MVEVATGLSFFLAIVGTFVFIAIKFMVSKVFEGWKGLVAKAIISFVLSVLAALAWNICPAASIILVFAVLIIGELLGFGIIYFAQYIPHVGGTVTYAFSIIAPVIIIWIVIAVIGFILDITSIILMFIPLGVTQIISIIISVAVLFLPLIQLILIWSQFTQQFSGLTECILGAGRTPAIPGTGGISIGAAK